MRCQYCNCAESKVIDSRPTEEGNSIRRRRECMGCGRRFTTYEKIEMLPLMVVKRDGRRETFDAQKIKAGILHACEKLPVSMQQIDAMTTSIEQRAYASMEGEISSQRIGDMVMEELKATNDVAYVRFAAVYRLFTDMERSCRSCKSCWMRGKSKASKMRWMRKKTRSSAFSLHEKGEAAYAASPDVIYFSMDSSQESNGLMPSRPATVGATFARPKPWPSFSS